MKILLLTVGRPKDAGLRALVEEYLGRIGAFARVQWETVREGGRTKDANVALEEEGKRLLRAVGKDDYLVVLDERGREYTTAAFARWLAERQLDARRVVFVIGGPFGLSKCVKQKADLLLSLSQLTLQHDIAALVLAEQLYRAFTLLAGLPYHK